MLKWISLLMFVAVLAACSPTPAPPTSAPPTIGLTAEPTLSASTDNQAEQAAASLPGWMTLRLTDARSGSSFTLADFAGKTVYVEPMATWCGNCRSQMNNLIQARQQINDPNIVYIALSVETTLSASDLAAYADRQGYEWTFAVMTPEILTALTDTFGRTVTNPPSTPHFMIYPDQTFSELDFGMIESVEELVQAITTRA
jgi:thiol-disulfide isomerase/thioredoxin